MCRKDAYKKVMLPGKLISTIFVLLVSLSYFVKYNNLHPMISGKCSDGYVLCMEKQTRGFKIHFVNTDGQYDPLCSVLHL